MTGAKKSQTDKFKETARELGCDESEERFDEALKRVAKAPSGKAVKSGTKTNGER